MQGAFDFHLQLSTDSTALGIGDAVPNERAGRVSVEPAGMGNAGADCCSDRTVTGNTGVIEVIE